MKADATSIEILGSSLQDLGAFRNQCKCKALLPRERRLIVRQALILLEQNYVHLPAKRALYAVDAVQRLKLLLRRIGTDESETQKACAGHPTTQEPLSESEFHREMLETFFSLRDPHTRYYLPTPYHGKVAFLPFMVEDIEEGGRRKYIVSKVSGCGDDAFTKEVEILYWNGTPIERAVEIHAQRCTGSNPEARRAEALLTLTMRALEEAPQPDEDWVVVTFRSLRNDVLHKEFPWRVVSFRAEAGEGKLPDAGGTEMNTALASMKRLQAMLFAEQKAEDPSAIRTCHRYTFAARPVDTKHGTFGYLRIWNFDLEEDTFVNEFIRLVEQLPKAGLIIDIRENPGGRMSAAEYTLQTLTCRRIEPEPVQFINTPLNLQICAASRPAEHLPDLGPWVQAIDEGLQTGATYSAAFPKSDVDKCNDKGQKYYGPVVLVTDALSYSAADMFAAGFQDHCIGTILGTDWRTGGGGANTWGYDEKFRAYKLAAYRKLPDGVGFKVAIRRSLRVGNRAGAVLEDFGVLAGERHAMTRADVMDRNRDLIEAAAYCLTQQNSRRY